MTNDAELLREYVESQSDAAFAELVGRHVNLVYSTALRMVRETLLAGTLTGWSFSRPQNWTGPKLQRAEPGRAGFQCSSTPIHSYENDIEHRT